MDEPVVHTHLLVFRPSGVCDAALATLFAPASLLLQEASTLRCDGLATRRKLDILRFAWMAGQSGFLFEWLLALF
ncbi:MAG: hypothetical protein EON49_04420 [Acidovorax sp.]|nr:MAG: hypothetical protein EON49_04420 [Acidovorax sp.]